ncbi:unnamed protein product [Urochloa decumbens]|uniref:Phosphatidic acid phosphatase type 2/haloperoxidase domain-containing protein n=1 Tax=Urochloa decumbens TaxID=240449 RepID=A0ABC9CHN4_9POAL
MQLPSPCPSPHLLPTPPSCRHRQCKEHVLLPLRWSRVRRLGVRMAEIARVGISAEGDATHARDEPRKPSQEEDRWAPVEAALNCASKWLVAGSYVFAVVWKHDVEIMWVLLGASANYLLSLILKRMLNHERPAPDLRSDPGMPSSHAQSICYAATLLVLSCKNFRETDSKNVLLPWDKLSDDGHWASNSVNGNLSIMATGAAAPSHAKPGHGWSWFRICLRCSVVSALAFARAEGIGFVTVEPDCGRPWVNNILCCGCHLRKWSLAQE